MTIIQWAMCGIILEGVLKDLRREDEEFENLSSWEKHLEHVIRTLISAASFALYGYLWNL